MEDYRKLARARPLWRGRKSDQSGGAKVVLSASITAMWGGWPQRALSPMNSGASGGREGLLLLCEELRHRAGALDGELLDLAVG